MRFFSFACLLSLVLLSPPLRAQVEITLKKDRVSVDINGAPFTSLFMGQEARKPYLYPLRTASGKKVSRGFPVEPAPGDPTDRPHQRGLWVGAEDVEVAGLGKMDFWENDPSYKRLTWAQSFSRRFSVKRALQLKAASHLLPTGSVRTAYLFSAKPKL